MGNAISISCLNAPENQYSTVTYLITGNITKVNYGVHFTPSEVHFLRARYVLTSIHMYVITEPPSIDITLEFINRTPRVEGSAVTVKLLIGNAYVEVYCSIRDNRQNCKSYMNSLFGFRFSEKNN